MYNLENNKTKTTLKKLLKTERKERKVGRFIGATKSTIEYDPKYTFVRKNLFAIVMPVAAGKSYYSKKYNLIDVDELCHDTPLFDRIAEYRDRCTKGQTTNRKTWETHNKLWYDYLNVRLDQLVLNKRTIIMVHTEELAMAIGATVMVAICPTEDVIKKGLVARNQRNLITLALHNRRTVLNRTKRASVAQPKSWEATESIVKYAVSQLMPTPAPLKDTDRADKLPAGWTSWEPLAMLYGAYDYITDDEVEAQYAAGMIPLVAYQDYYKVKYGRCVGDKEDKVEWFDILNAIDATEQRTKYARDNKIRRSRVKGPLTYEHFPPYSKRNASTQLVRTNDILTLENYDSTTHDIVAAHFGQPEHYLCNLLCWYVMVASQFTPLVREALIRSKILETPMEAMMIHGKAIGNYVRSSKLFGSLPLTDFEYENLQYMYCLCGSVPYDMAPEAEIAKRMDLQMDKFSYAKGTWSTSQYHRDVVESIHELANEADIRYGEVQEFFDWWDTRKEELVAGATGETFGIGHKKQMIKIIDGTGRVWKELHENVPKTGLLEENVLSEFFQKMECSSYTKVSAKHGEQGKQRAILSADIVHYLLFSYLLSRFRKLSNWGGTLLGEHFEDQGILEMRHAVHDAIGLKKFLMYDYDDYNSQHSLLDMATLFQILYNNHPEPMKLITAWCIKSFENLRIYDGEQYQSINSGLMTGWRTTQFINTLLNGVYCRVIIKNYTRLYGYDPISSYVGSGDDCEMGVLQTKDMIQLYEVTEKIGFASQESKQMFTLDSRKEFLRMMHINGVTRGSLTRLLPRAISGNVEGDKESNTPEQRLMSGIEVCNLLVKRGLLENHKLFLQSCIIKKMGRFRGKEGFQRMCDTLIHAPRSLGGLGVPDKSGHLWLTDYRNKPNVQLHYVGEFDNATNMLMAKIDMTVKRWGAELVDKQNIKRSLLTGSYKVTGIKGEDVIEEIEGLSEYYTKENVVHVRVGAHLLQSEMSTFFLRTGLNKRRRPGILEMLKGKVVYNDEILNEEQLHALFGHKIQRDVEIFDDYKLIDWVRSNVTAGLDEYTIEEREYNDVIHSFIVLCQQ
jgi:hypothetical protein